MGTFAFEDDDRERWAEEAAAAMVALSATVRDRMAAKIGAGLPSDPSAVFDPEWWYDGLAGPVNDRFTAISVEAAGKFHEGAGWGPIPKTLATSIATSVAASMIGNMGGRADIITERVTQLVSQGTETNLSIESGESSAVPRSGEWLTDQLALDTGDGGPLSDALMDDFGRNATTNLAGASAQGVMDEYDITARREWTCIFSNSRPEHMDANGQIAEPGEPFNIDGYDAMYPGDESLPDYLLINCQCYCSYDLPDEIPQSDDSEEVPSPIMADVGAFSLQGLTGRTGRWATDNFEVVGALAVTFADAVPAPTPGIPADGAAGVPDYTDSVCITIEPTAAEKQMLAVPGGLDPVDLHVTLGYLGKIADLDDAARLTIGTVLSQVAEKTAPFEGDVAGIGWFGSESSITVALIDGDGVAALRTAIVDLLIAAGIPVADDHDLIPHCTLAYSQVDAADKVGMPLHFNELRLRFGDEVLAFDLMGPIETAPDAPAPQPETAPTVPVPPPTEAPAMTVTFDDSPPVDGSPIPVDDGTAPPDLSTVPDDILTAELARRAADTVVAEVVAQTGQEATPDQVAAATAATEEEAAEIMDDLTDAAEMVLGLVDEDATPDEEPDQEPPAGGMAARAAARTRLLRFAADLSGVSDDDLAIEVASRAANRLLSEIAAVSGTDVDPMLATQIQDAAVGEAADLWDDMADAIADATGIENDDRDQPVNNDDTNPESSPVGVPMYANARHTNPRSPYTVSSGYLQVVRTGAGGDSGSGTLVTVAPTTATFTVGGKADLPIADREMAWDAAAADQRVQKWASSDGSGDKDKIDFGKYGDAFFWHDPDMADQLTGFKLQFADIVNGRLEAVPKGVFAVAGVLSGARGGADIPQAEQDQIKSRVNGYYERFAKEWNDPTVKAPWAAALGLESMPGVCDDTIPVERDTGVPFAVDGIPPAPEGVVYDMTGILCVEGIPSGDGRMIGEGASTWRQLPIPVAFVNKITTQHQEGQFVGWIHEIWRDGASIWANMTLVDNEPANELRGYLADPKGAGRFGCSVDMTDVTSVYSDVDGLILDPMEAQDAYYAGENVVELMISATIAGVTVVMHPAFQEANVWLIDSCEPDQAIIAAGGVSTVSWSTYLSDSLGPYGSDVSAIVASAGVVVDVPAPPAALFGLRPMPVPEPFTVGAPLPDGTVPCYGLLAQNGTCHIGSGRKCISVPSSADFRSFYTGKRVLTAEGDLLPVGPIIMDTVHPDLLWQASDTQAFYAHTGSAVADVRLYRNEWGIVAAGVISPDALPSQVRRLRASDVSPDWRPIVDETGRKEHKIVAVLAVNASGFLVEGIAASAGRMQAWAGFDADGEMVGLVAAGAMIRERTDRELLVGLRAELAETRAHLAALSDCVLGIDSSLNQDKAIEALAKLGVDAPLVVSRKRAARMALRRMGIGDGQVMPVSSCHCSD